MTGAQAIGRALEQIPEKKLIFASQLYTEQFRGKVSEGAYYKTIERLCKSGDLCKIAKGTYFRPKTSKYGIVPPSQQEIISAFTEPDTGAVVGYSLYNRLKLTTQVTKTVEIYSARIGQQTKQIGTISLRFCDLVYTPEVRSMIYMLEVLQNFSRIQDLNYKQFLAFCEQFAMGYTDSVFETVNRQLYYQKRTISFLQAVLTHFGVPNHLGKHLSTLSEYKHPTMEELYEAAQLS